MNIKLLDSHLRDYLKTKATAHQIAEKLSLTSVGIERIHPYQKDFVYDIEVTTNRPDLASIIGIAREAHAVLPQFGIDAHFVAPVFKTPDKPKEKVPLLIKNDPHLVHRICAVVMDVQISDSPQYIRERLEQSDIRSINNIVDVTNYIMRTIGHPAHVFDYDRIMGHSIVIRQSKKGETISTLDKKTYTLSGGDIIAEDGQGRIIDLLGIMGLENSVVTSDTKRIVLFLNNNDIVKIRKTSMGLLIRSEAAQLNEKSIDPELAMNALLFGIELYEKIAQGKVISEIIDIYPNKPKEKSISVTEEKINALIGIPIPLKTAVQILTDLGFKSSIKNNTITAKIPSYRLNDMDIPEDLIEEIARVFGYHNLPSIIPPYTATAITKLESNPFYFEKKTKEALKYWGYTETYTYSFVSDKLYEGPLDNAIELQNPLSSDWVYMRKNITPSLLEVVKDNKGRDTIKIFELANVYTKNKNDLPIETRMLAGVFKKPNASFFEVKGIIEQLCTDLGINSLHFTKRKAGGNGADVFIEKERIGEIEVLDENIIDFELNFEIINAHATGKKIYKPISKYPPIIEDVTFILSEDIPTGDILEEINQQSELIVDTTLLDTYQNTRTFHITYQHAEKNLTTSDIETIRGHVIKTISSKFKATVK